MPYDAYILGEMSQFRISALHAAGCRRCKLLELLRLS
jgi:hypothetical protein